MFKTPFSFNAKNLFAIILVFAGLTAGSQEVQKLDFCQCIDKIDQTSPSLNGKFQRECDGKLNETGAFEAGVKVGEWVTYSKKGTVIKKVNYSKGKLSGPVELFYFNGKPKLRASFEDGKPAAEWTYYTSNGKVLINGKYDSGKPVDLWTIYKGSKSVVQYDFNNSKYIVKSQPDTRSSGSFMRNDNTGEYFFFYFSTEGPVEETAPLGGQKFAISLLQDLYEIPLDYWDTFIQYEYLATVSVAKTHQANFSISRTDKEYSINKEIVYPFIIKTNPDSKIKKVDHTELSRKLLDMKIEETFSFLPPWVFSGQSEVKIHLPYVINRISRQADLDKPKETEYN
jgi:hypothetical protein